jgi:hypothetical protein
MNQPPPTEKQMGKRIVSKGAYACVKSLAVCLSGGVFACGAGITLLLASLPYAYYLDVKTEAQTRIKWGLSPTDTTDLDLLFSYFGIAKWLCVIFVPILLITGFLLWMGSRKSWKTVRNTASITRANTADIPAPDSLVRASSEPEQVQKAVLLRAVTETDERHEEQLVRAADSQE